MSAQKTILHIIDTTGPGGAETIFIQLANEAKKREYRSIALVRGEGWVAEQLRKHEVTTYFYNCKGSFNFSYLKFLIKLIRKENVNLIQAHLLGSNVYASMAGLITSIPVFCTFHGFVDISKKERFGAAKFLAIRMGAKKIIAVTQQLYEGLNDSRWFSAKQLMVIQNGIDLTVFPQKIDQKLSTPVHIGCLGNVRKAKNYPLAIKMLDELVNSFGLDVVLHIAGDDKNQLAEECRELANELGLSSRIIWHGFINSAAEYLDSLDMYLLSSSSEGHPLALTQAMSVGLPIVVTDCGVDSVIRDGYSALIAANNDSSDLAKMITSIINDHALRIKIANNAAKDAREKWSLQVTYEKYFSLYAHGLLEKSRSFLTTKFGGRKAFLNYVFFAIKASLAGYHFKCGAVSKRPGRVVFVCKGNICRSAFAEWYFKKHSNIPCVSLGVDTTSGVEANQRISRLSLDMDVDLSGHRTTAIENFVPCDGDLYVCMEPSHLEKISLISAKKEISLLGLNASPFAAYIHDPYAAPELYARNCLMQIAHAVDQLIDRIEKLKRK
ncbi:glycosyltransferase [Cellvibrio sp. NN19]|uniref:glycosyltransferase n=1 Tax=Cellvibrio chitinivorans TaxID=3102792 RepID=UPI002B405977|nr:glycosyltransferase [Cellvibrio sp. NN19]